MSIPPSSPYPQSIQEILDEGRRNAEAARNAPKPHPAQPMLDYHDQVARENNAYDYDPELLAALASQNQQQATPTDAIKFGHDNGLFDHFPDDMAPSANPPQSVRVAEFYNLGDDLNHRLHGYKADQNREENEKSIEIVERLDVGPSRTPQGAAAKVLRRLHQLQTSTGYEHGLRIYLYAGSFVPSVIVKSDDPKQVNLSDTKMGINGTVYIDIYTEPTENMSIIDRPDNEEDVPVSQIMISASGVVEYYNADKRRTTKMTIDEFIAEYGETEAQEQSE